MRRWLAVVASCALLFGAVTADAPAAHAKANRFLKKAKKAYENLDYTRVTPLLNRALKTAKNEQDEIEIYFLLGTMHAIYSRERQAKEAFAEVLKRDPTFELPPDTSPKIRTAFGEAREATGGQVVSSEDEEEPALDPIVPDDEGAPEDGEIDADVSEELPAEIFGPTDEGMPGLTRQRRGSPWYKKWWVWTIVGAVVAGGTGYLVYSLNQVDYPNRDFGPVPLK